MDPRADQFVSDAEQHWIAGRFYEAGRVLYEHVLETNRAPWATNILAQAYGYFEPIAEIDHVLMLGSDPARWGDAYAAFWPLRQVTLRTEELPLEQSILRLAENTCKVVYNASRQRAPFDHDAGWWIPGISSIRQGRQ